MTATVEPLSAPIELSFDYTRSLGPTLGAFMTALSRRRVIGTRGSDGRVFVPPLEYDPVSGAALTEFADVGDEGEVRSWTWAPAPLAGQPLDRPFAWVQVRLDGADTTILHALDVASPDDVSVGMRVRVRWAAAPRGHISDITCFEPATGARPPRSTSGGNPDLTEITMMTTPIAMRVMHSASPEETVYLQGLLEGRFVGQRCPECGKVYLPPRSACPVDGVPTEEDVELPDRGIVTTFCIVNVPFQGQRIPPPYVAAYVLLDGADIPFLHLILDCPAEDVRMGMRVEAVWAPREEWVPSIENVTHFRPTGEPDADYESYREHL